MRILFIGKSHTRFPRKACHTLNQKPNYKTSDATSDMSCKSAQSWKCIDMDQLLNCAESSIKWADILMKLWTPGVLVCTLCDFDLMKENDESLFAIPVCCGLAGKSITIDILRKLASGVLLKIRQKLFHVDCKFIDGQMFKWAVEDNWKCLLLLQEQNKL